MSRLPDESAEERGRLIVDGPHWAAELILYDGNLRQVVRGVGELDERVPAGLYRVETRLADARETQIVAVAPGGRTLLSRDSWKIEFASAAPLVGTRTSREFHEGPATELSRKVTWPGAPGGDSRLFLFARTLEPAKYPRFSEGLHLLTGDGRLVTDFGEGVERDFEQGWLACTADLPPGPYVLRVGRKGVPVRHQPLWLCPDWETQVFVPARKWPLLAELSLWMASKGAGFYPDDDEILAAEAVLGGLQQGKNLASSSQMRHLLSGKFHNPWVGILAANALLLDPEPDEDLLRIVRHNLSNLVQDHPDVRALMLQRDAAAERPFTFPPMLRTSLKRLQEHSLLHETTVPLDSLTDRIFDHLLADAPWTAWGNLRPSARKVALPPTPPHTTFLQTATIERLRETVSPALETVGLPKRTMEDLPEKWHRLLFEEIRGLQQVEFALWAARQDPAQIGRELGLPRARVKNVLDALTQRPGLMEDPKSLPATDRAAVAYLRERFGFESRRGLIEQEEDLRILFIDPEGRPRYASPSFEKLTGYSLEELPGVREILDSLRRGPAEKTALPRKEQPPLETRIVGAPLTDASGQEIGTLYVVGEPGREMDKDENGGKHASKKR